MNCSECFTGELPEPLSDYQLCELFVKYNSGDIKAKEKLAKHNVAIVLCQVLKKFSTTVDYAQSDLVSVGNIGLMKAIDTYDISRNVSFLTYALKCIDNEILQFLGKLKKYQNIDSLDELVISSKLDEYSDIITDEKDVIENYEDLEINFIIRQTVDALPERNREIIKLYFGFYDDKAYSQMEIANMFSISQPRVSRIIKKTVNDLSLKLQKDGIIELNSVKDGNETKNLVKKQMF